MSSERQAGYWGERHTLRGQRDSALNRVKNLERKLAAKDAEIAGLREELEDAKGYRVVMKKGAYLYAKLRAALGLDSFAKCEDVERVASLLREEHASLSRRVAYYEEAVCYSGRYWQIQDGPSTKAIEPEKVSAVLRERTQLQAENAKLREERGAFGWRDGCPPHPWDKEWFLAETVHRERVVLRALPEEHSYDYETCDQTYISASRIARWMQLPGGEFVPFLDAGVAELRERVAELEEALDPCDPEFVFLRDARALASRCTEKFGPHRSAEFACCRIAEEVGELVQAATAMSKGRDRDRTEAVRSEALDAVAMILRLMREYPDGLVAAALPQPSAPEPQDEDEDERCHLWRFIDGVERCVYCGMPSAAEPESNATATSARLASDDADRRCDDMVRKLNPFPAEPEGGRDE